MIERIGIIGGGVMGNGLARFFLGKGYMVKVAEANHHLAETFEEKLKESYLVGVRKGKITEEDASQCISRLSVDAEVGALQHSDFILEAVSEDLLLKKSVLSNLESFISSEVIIASNTSAIPISVLSAALSHPDRFIGTHFFNPAHIMPLVEVIRGMDSSPEVLDRVSRFLSSAGKNPVTVKDCPGFLVNRVLGAYMNEALWILEDSAAVQDVEAGAKSMGLPMGPLSLGEMVGWDVIHASNETLERYYGERFKIPPLLNRLIALKRYGQKTGLGFFDHSQSPPLATNDLVCVKGRLEGGGVTQIKERLKCAMIAESIRCLDEGVSSPSEIDLALVSGAGLPKGPLAWADELGLDFLLDRLEAYSHKLGMRFWPAPILRISVLAGFKGVASGRGLAGRY